MVKVVKQDIPDLLQSVFKYSINLIHHVRSNIFRSLVSNLNNRLKGDVPNVGAFYDKVQVQAQWYMCAYVALDLRCCRSMYRKLE